MTFDQRPVRLGLRENLAQFSLLVVVNAFVGAMVGMERTLLSPIAEQEFHLAAKTAVLSFIVVFGVTKALTNYLAGRLSDRFGRKHVLVAGWLVAAPVPFLLMWAPSWGWVLFANALLGVSQGLTWSTTVIMKIDLAGPKKRGLAMGLNEFAGYFAVGGQRARDRPHRCGVRPPAPSPSTSAWSSWRSASSCPRFWCGRRSTTSPPSRSCMRRSRPSPGSSRSARSFSAPRCSTATSRASPRRASSTTSTTAWRGGSFLSSSPPRGWTSKPSGRSPRSIRRPGASRSSSPARGPIGSGASGSSPGGCGSRRWASAWWCSRAGSRASRSARRSSASAPRWSTRRCSPPSAMWRIRRGARPRWACIGCGATSAMRSARSSRASSPTRWASPPRCGRSPRSRSRRVSSSRCG